MMSSSFEYDFCFAFNDSNFSDRVLRIEIMPDPVGAPPNSDAAADCTRSHEDLPVWLVQLVFNGNENQDEEFAANNKWTMDCSADTVVTVKTLHINSSLLAAKSPFFYKLFSNGMRESKQSHVTLRINASEEAALVELLKFMYKNTLSFTAASDVLDVLLAADKFEVSSCMRYCSSWLLQNSPMTADSALLYLEQLPHHTDAVQPLANAAKQYLASAVFDVLMVMAADDKFEVSSHCSSWLLQNSPMTTDSALRYLEQLPHTSAVLPLIDAAKQYLTGRYKDITKFQKEVMALPLCGIEAILASDDLQVDSEDAVYDFVLSWLKLHYNSRNERLEVLRSRLGPLIRFPYMSPFYIFKAYKHDSKPKPKRNNIYHLVSEALIFKAEAPHLQRKRSLAAEELNHRRFVERAYKCRPIKLVHFELPLLHQCVVYLDLKREECATLFPSGRVCSESFELYTREFFISAECNMDQQGSFHCFGLFLEKHTNDGGWRRSSDVDYEFAARSRPTQEFASMYKGNFTVTGGKVVGPKNLFAIPWNSFIAEDSLLFINGVLHLKAEVTINIH